jgi:hypothetical protein
MYNLVKMKVNFEHQHIQYEACWSNTKWILSSSHQNLTCSHHDIIAHLVFSHSPQFSFNMYNHPLTADSVIQHYKNPTKRVGLVQSGPHHYFIEK